jgi:hypothetical protein
MKIGRGHMGPPPKTAFRGWGVPSYLSEGQQAPPRQRPSAIGMRQGRRVTGQAQLLFINP